MAGMQVNGIASQLDTASIIDALLTFDNQNVTLLQYDQAQKTNQISTYQSINAKLLSFQTQAKLLTKTNSFSATNVSVSDDSYLTAAANKKIGLGSYAINVEALAQNQQLASQGFADESSSLLGDGTVTIKVGDGSEVSFTLDSSNNSLRGLRDAINAGSADVTASIINDGSSNDPYRLLLTSNKTGAANKMSITSDLTGGKAPDFASASFDEVEPISFSGTATSIPTLGASSSYTGNQNKTYTFTVQGSGAQTVGSGDILVDWTDGTNSGTITVGAADTEVEVKTDTFDEGLTLSFAAGDLVAGDTFQVQALAPVLQQAQDAKVSIGSTSGGGSPITVTSSTNQIDNLVTGLSLSLKKVTDSGPIIVNVGRDVDKVEGLVQDFVDSFNTVFDAIDEQFKYDPKTDKEASALFGDSTLMMIQNTLRSRTLSNVTGLDGDYRMLADLGIRFDGEGHLSIEDSAKLRDAIAKNLDAVIRVFATTGESSSSRISFLAAGADTVASADGYEVKITQAATKGHFRGASITDPQSTPIVIDEPNKNFKLIVNGVQSDNMILDKGTYNSFAELANEMQQKIDADPYIAKFGVEVNYVDVGGEGYFDIDSNTYGSSSSVLMGVGVQDTVFSTLGLEDGTSYKGQDVAGTINGESATGSGQFLTGDDGNDTTAGLRLLVELTENELKTFDSATVTITKGVAAKAGDFVDSLTKSTSGTIAMREKALQDQVDDIKDQITDMQDRIDLKRQRLQQKYLEMEQVLGQLDSQASYLEAQFQNMYKNWGNSISTNTTQGQ